MRNHRVDGRFRIVASLLALTLGSGCVVLRRDYDALAEQHRSEAAARRTAETQLATAKLKMADLEQRVAELEARLVQSDQVLEKRESELDARMQTLAKAEFDYSVLEREKAEAAALVAQLRSELERLGQHLQAYAADKESLAAEREALLEQLQRAEARVDTLGVAGVVAGERLELVKGLALMLKPQLESEAATMSSDGDAIVVELATAGLFRPRSAELQPRAKPLLGSMGELLREGTTTLELTLLDAKHSSRLVQQRLERVSRTLVEAKIPAQRLHVNGTEAGASPGHERLRLRILPTRLPEATKGEEAPKAVGVAPAGASVVPQGTSRQAAANATR